MRFTTIREDYEYGHSTVTIKTRWGEYTGESFCHPEDNPHKSKFFGLAIALVRAQVKAYQGKAAAMRERKHAIDVAIVNLKYKGLPFEALLGESKHYKKLINEAEGCAAVLKKQIANSVEARYTYFKNK